MTLFKLIVKESLINISNSLLKIQISNKFSLFNITHAQFLLSNAIPRESGAR